MHWRRWALAGGLLALLAVGASLIARRFKSPVAPRRPRAVAGVAVDRMGAPIGGARVVALAGGQEVGRGESAEDGRYRIEVAGRGPFRVRISAPGFRTEALTEATGENEIQVVLLHTRALEGVTRMAGRPVGDVEVTLGGAAGTRTVRSGPDGAFTFADLVEGRYALRATAKSGAAAYLPAVPVGEPEDGGIGILAVELALGRRLLGSLADGDGRPIAGGEVTLAEGVGAALPRYATTDARGRFYFTAVLPGSYLVAARAAGFQPGAARPDKVPGPPIALTLLRGATISGRVIDEDGRPIAGAELSISGEDDVGAPLVLTKLDSGRSSLRSVELEPAGELGVLRGPIPYPPLTAAPEAKGAGGGGGAFLSDARGLFRIDGLPAGRLVVAATHPGFAGGASRPLALAVGTSVKVEIVLAAGISVRGRVTDPEGQPIEGAEVAAAAGAVAATDGGGEYALDHVLPTSVLRVRAHGFESASQPAAETVDFQLARADSRVAGVVVDENGQPIARARIELSRSSGPSKDGGLDPDRTAFSDADGRFSLEGLPHGPYELAVSAEGLAPVRMDAVAAGDGLAITLRAGGGLAGSVVDARSGVPIGEAHIEISAGGSRRQLTADKGRFSARALAPGSVRLEVHAPGYVTWSHELHVPAGDRPQQITLDDVEVDLERAGAVRGEVRDEEGRGVARALVECGAVRARADGRGRFRCDGVAPGEITVRATAGTRVGSGVADVREGEEQRVTVVVQ